MVSCASTGAARRPRTRAAAAAAAVLENFNKGRSSVGVRLTLQTKAECVNESQTFIDEGGALRQGLVYAYI
jgi:hypothetical protein